MAFIGAVEGRCGPRQRSVKAPLCICGDMSVLKFAYEFALVVFATVAEHLERVGFGNVGTAYLFLLPTSSIIFFSIFGKSSDVILCSPGSMS